MLVRPHIKRLVGWIILGFVLAEILAWIYLSIFPLPPENIGSEGDSLVEGLFILGLFGFTGAVTGGLAAFYKRK